MTATINDHRGQALTGEIKCWMGRRIVEIETPDGSRHIGHLQDAETTPGSVRRSTADGGQ